MELRLDGKTAVITGASRGIGQAMASSFAAAGASDAQVFKFFTAKYGPTSLAEPVRGGFDTVAWIGPFAFLLIGIVLILLLLRLWKARHDRLAPVAPLPPTPDADALRDRIRDETNYGE